LALISGCSHYRSDTQDTTAQGNQSASAQGNANTRASVLASAPKSAANERCVAGSQELRDPPTLVGANGGLILRTELDARVVSKCVDGKWIQLKSYIDRTLGMDNRPVGPAYVMRVAPERPNPQMFINFKNALEVPARPDYNCGMHDQDHAQHEGGDNDVQLCTNLHTHGFHVSPTAPSDDVFLVFSPNSPRYPYHFDIPSDHAPGTHWMHAHLHGSTAPQVKNGMAGALILKGEIDEWLQRDYGIGGDKDKIMILQQMALPDSSGNDQPLCNNGIVTSVNGQCLPTITVLAEDVYHLRLIHAGVSATVNFGLQNSFGESVTLREYARDGVTMQQAIDREEVTLHPGYRSDVLFKVPQCPGNRYPCVMNVVDEATSNNKSLYGEAEPQAMIARVVVRGLSTRPMRLPARDAVGFKNPYRFIPDTELEKEGDKYKTQKIWFANEPKPGGGTYKTVNGSIYPAGETETLTLETATLWKLWVGEKQDPNSGASHPFHIHVNPFQVTETDVNGFEFNYWKDTLFISGSDNYGEDNAITVRSRYEDFDGAFVLHCHNLNHEDDGMMKRVEIVK
jgi:FtsP/CotA-like multicopper oxidase with cupredoxin domain